MFISILIFKIRIRYKNIKLIISPECHKILLFARSLLLSDIINSNYQFLDEAHTCYFYRRYSYHDVTIFSRIWLEWVMRY